MPPIDTGGARIKRGAPLHERHPTRRAPGRRTANRTIEKAQTLTGITPDHADRLRSVAQRAHDAEIVRRNVAESRLKVLRKRNAGSGTRAVKRELEGKGVVAAALGGAGNLLAHLDPASGMSKTSFADDSFKKSLKSEAAGVGLPDAAPAKVIKDLVAAPGAVVPSVYIPIAGLYEKHKGRPQRLDALIKDLKEHDPVYNAGAAGVAVAKGDTKGARQHWRKAKKAVSEHPGYALLEGRGLRAPIGRGGGAGVRTAARVAKSGTAERVARATGTNPARVAAADALHKIGTTKRAPKTLPGTNLVVPRRYDRNLLGKAEQVLSERDKQHKSDEYARRAAAATDESQRKELRAQARAHDPKIISDKEIQRAVDEHQAMSEDLRRINQGEVLKGEKELKHAEKAGPIVSLLAQRIAKPTLAALKEYRDDITVAGKSLTGAKASANRQLVGDLNKAISKVESGKVSLADMKGLADRYTGRNRALQTKLTATGIYNAEESERRAAAPGLVREDVIKRDLPLLAEREAAAGKTRKQTARAAKTTRGKALGRASEHKRLTAEELARATALPQREPTAHAALLAAQQLAQKARAKQVKATRTKAKHLTAAAETARTAHKQATATRRADPWLMEQKVTRDVGKGKKTKKVTTKEWQPVDTPQMLDALEKLHGEGARAAVVTQRPPQRASGADFFTSGTRAPSGEARTFTGEATKQGTFEGSPDTLRRQNVKSQALVDAFDSFKGFAQHFGLRKKDGQLEHENFDDARQIADDRSAEGDVKWTVVRAAPRGADEQLATTLQGTADSSVAQMFNDALNPRKGDDGPWVVVPEAAVKQLQAHVNALNPGDINRFLRSFGSGVRRVILATSLPWAVGNTAEAGFRSVLHGVGPRSWITGHAVLKEAKAADPEMTKALRARSVGGGHYALADRTIHSNVDAYRAGWMKDVMTHAETLRGWPVAKQASWLWDRWTHHVFDTVNKTIEQQFQTAMLGKAIRHDLMDGELRKTFNKAANQRAAGKALDPNTASALGREVDRMYGKYSKFDPDTRAIIAQYTPFLAWTRNALTFLGRAPTDLPGSTGTAAALVNATEDTRAKWDKGKDLPSFLRGSIPASDLPREWRDALGMKPGGHWRPGRFTPLGLAADPLGGIGGVVLPQWHSMLNASQGLDWTGRKLPSKTGEPDTYEKAAAIGNAFLDETLPFLSVGKRVKGKGWQTIPQSAIGYAPPGQTKTSTSGYTPLPGSSTSSKFERRAQPGSRFSSGSRFSGSRFK